MPENVSPAGFDSLRSLLPFPSPTVAGCTVTTFAARRSARRLRKMGPVGLVDKRPGYVQRMKGGHCTLAACRIRGISRNTGSRWLNGRNGVPGLRQQGLDPRRWLPVPVANGSGHYLSEDERMLIADRLLARSSVRSIARRWTVPINDQPGACPQPTGHQTLSSVSCSEDGRRQAPENPALQVGRRPRVRRGTPGAAVESSTGLPSVDETVSRGVPPASGPRNDLSCALQTEHPACAEGLRPAATVRKVQ